MNQANNLETLAGGMSLCRCRFASPILQTGHPQFGPPNVTIGNAGAATITTTVGNPRPHQFALKIQF